MRLLSLFRLSLCICILVLIIGLRLDIEEFALMKWVFAPLLLLFGLSFLESFTNHWSRLASVSTPIIVIYWMGFGPWILDYDRLLGASSTSVLDFLIIPTWSIVCALGLLILNEIRLQVTRLILKFESANKSI